MQEDALRLIYKFIGYINLTLSCIIICTILCWIVKLIKYTHLANIASKLVASKRVDVVQKRELTNKRTDYHKGILLLLILSLELIQKVTAVATYGVINILNQNTTTNNTCSSKSSLELYSIMNHTPSVLVLRAISNAAVLGMLSCIILTLVYLTNAYGERGDRRNFRNICIYTVAHCTVILPLSCFLHTWLFGYVIYELMSIIDFILILRSAIELNRVLKVRIVEAGLEFDKYNFWYRYNIQRRYKLVISGVMLCLFIFVLGVFVQRIATIISVLTDFPCFIYQTYNLPIYLFLSEDGKTAVKIVSHCFLVSFYVLILIFDFLFVFLNISAILLLSCPEVLACKYFHSDKKIRSTLEPLLTKYHKSIRTK